ncbi:hypothetical protein [Photobacterium kasasachensis]|uniref:hypothetical protein n=1 Tax=Photobacterium kasasachensis TaxID=2910240 RepID=UPI003D114B2B
MRRVGGRLVGDGFDQGPARVVPVLGQVAGGIDGAGLPARLVIDEVPGAPAPGGLDHIAGAVVIGVAHHPAGAFAVLLRIRGGRHLPGLVVGIARRAVKGSIDGGAELPDMGLGNSGAVEPAAGIGMVPVHPLVGHLPCGVVNRLGHQPVMTHHRILATRLVIEIVRPLAGWRLRHRQLAAGIIDTPGQVVHAAVCGVDADQPPCRIKARGGYLPFRVGHLHRVAAIDRAGAVAVGIGNPRHPALAVIAVAGRMGGAVLDRYLLAQQAVLVIDELGPHRGTVEDADTGTVDMGIVAGFGQLVTAIVEVVGAAGEGLVLAVAPAVHLAQRQLAGNRQRGDIVFPAVIADGGRKRPFGLVVVGGNPSLGVNGIAQVFFAVIDKAGGGRVAGLIQVDRLAEQQLAAIAPFGLVPLRVHGTGTVPRTVIGVRGSVVTGGCVVNPAEVPLAVIVVPGIKLARGRIQAAGAWRQRARQPLGTVEIIRPGPVEPVLYLGMAAAIGVAQRLPGTVSHTGDPAVAVVGKADLAAVALAYLADTLAVAGIFVGGGERAAVQLRLDL